MAEVIQVEVVLALSDRQVVRSVSLVAGATVRQAIAASGIEQASPGHVDAQRVGIFARRVTLDQVLCDGDRVELYRPLQRDPKEARRRRAAPG